MTHIEYYLAAGIYSKYKRKIKRKIKEQHPIYKMISRTDDGMKCFWKSEDGKSMVSGEFEGHGQPATITLIGTIDSFVIDMDKMMIGIIDEEGEDSVKRVEMTKDELRKRGSSVFGKRFELEKMFRLRDMKVVEDEMRRKGAPESWIKMEKEKEKQREKKLEEEIKRELGMI